MMGFLDLFLKPNRSDGKKTIKQEKRDLVFTDILMLSYAEKYLAGKTVPRFWKYDYNISDVYSVIDFLTRSGYINDGKLTEEGKSVLERNEYVLYFHRKKPTDISLEKLESLIKENPDKNFRDLIWGEWNRLLSEYICNSEIGRYRNIKYAMFRFLIEEDKHLEAFRFLSEVFFIDLNNCEDPFVAPALIKDFKSLSPIVNKTKTEMLDFLNGHLSRIYAPIDNYSVREVSEMIIAYTFGEDDLAERIFNKKRR